MLECFKNFIILFYVTLFLVFKVGGLHALTHDEDYSNIQHCKICEISTTVNFTPLLKTGTIVLPSTKYFFVKQRLNNKALVDIHKNNYFSGYLFARPPPPQSLRFIL